MQTVRVLGARYSLDAAGAGVLKGRGSKREVEEGIFVTAFGSLEKGEVFAVL